MKKQGILLIISGPSGSGKSTFLRCINRLETVTSGEIVVDGFENLDDIDQAKAVIFDTSENKVQTIEMSDKSIYEVTNRETFTDSNILLYSVNNVTEQVTLGAFNFKLETQTNDDQDIIFYGHENNLKLGSGDDSVIIKSQRSYIYAGDGNDKLYNYATDSTGNGEGDDDYLETLNAYGTINGGEGNDELTINTTMANGVRTYGGNGNDVYYIKHQKP